VTRAGELSAARDQTITPVTLERNGSGLPLRKLMRKKTPLAKAYAQITRKLML